MNSRKKIKIDCGSLVTLGGEANDDEQQQRKRKQKSIDKGSSILTASRTCLMELNDDCLLEIFERCDVMDLYSIAQSCTYLKKIILQLFGRKFKILKMNFSDIVSVKEAKDARRLFSTFGSLIIEVEISFKEFIQYYKDPNSAGIIEAISRYCTSLKSLKLASFNIPDNENSFIAMCQLFGRLEKLYLEHVFIEGCYYDWRNYDVLITPNGNSMHFFDNCVSMTELKLVESYFIYEDIYKKSFPRLEHFIIEDSKGCDHKSLNEFITRHTNLKTFSLDCEGGHLPVVAATCKRLETFGFRFDYEYSEPTQTSVESLAEFRNLKELTVFFVGDEDIMSKLVKVLPKLAHSLEVLDMRYGSGTHDLIQTVSSLKRLRVFRLFDISSHHTMDLNLNPLTELIELNELSLDSCSTRGRTIKFDIVNIVNRLDKLTKLKLYVNDYKMQRKTYLQLLNCVESRPAARKRYLVIDCPTTDDYKHLFRAAVKIEKLPSFAY